VGEKKCIQDLWSEKLEVKEASERPSGGGGCRWEGNIKMDLKELGSEEVE
jgi:hypothetical protein